MHNWLVLALILSTAISCSSPSGSAAVDRSKWVLKLNVENEEIVLPLEYMYVHLTDDEAYPESFEIRGPSVYLVGEFPLSLRVGYGEEWENIIGKQVKIANRVRPDYYWIEDPSTITLPGAPLRYISSGSITFKKVSGKYAGLEGDMTLSGEIILNISVGSDIMVVKGTFSVHAVSLG